MKTRTALICLMVAVIVSVAIYIAVSEPQYPEMDTLAKGGIIVWRGKSTFVFTLTNGSHLVKSYVLYTNDEWRIDLEEHYLFKIDGFEFIAEYENFKDIPNYQTFMSGGI